MLFPLFERLRVKKLKIPQLTLAMIAQLGRHDTVDTRSEHYSPSVSGSIPVRVTGSIPVRVTFLQNLFCSNTILVELLKI